ncbi:TerD family protein [Streptomyces sp. NBC_01244]|uniref:TerD family protein n=1 Tax=Streptomyces sp. NBC_01244 TaxID=2903797 RepID=UPI002E15F00A|nr:tellurium resistance TerZ family protein [Streptomyces sp. NBC_01244]
MRHSGGCCPWDDEAITVDFTRVRPEVDQVVFTVNSFAGVTFDKVGHAYCRVVDDTTGGELARYTVSGGGTHTTQIMAKLVRLRVGWQLAAIGEPAAGE